MKHAISSVFFGRRPFRLVPQEHGLGCAVACVASRCRLSYAQALSLFKNPTNAWTRGYYCPEVVEALEKAGFKYAFARFDAVLHERLLKNPGTIVFLEPSAKYSAGHYLVRGRNGWMNPWANWPQMLPLRTAMQVNLPGQVEYLIHER